MSKKWICSTDDSHVFDQPTGDLFCSKCPPYSGVLIEKEEKDNTNSGGTSSPLGGPGSPTNESSVKKSIGLYIFLIDSSGSMFSEDAFPNVPMKRAKLVSGQVASAIFEMENLNKKEDAYLFVMLFDHRLQPFINFMNVKEIFDKYGDVTKLESELYKEMESLKGATDINLALENAYAHTQKFINGEMDVIGKVEPMTNSVLNLQTGDDKTYPNVRCMIFTDGDQYTGKGNEKIEKNPFADFKYNDQDVNVLMGAFHGESDSAGYGQLKAIMGNCHIHDTPQFFHFSEASQTMRMRHLFRMGSGPAVFCEKCLDNFITDQSKQ
jgi:hypothetical protein